MSNGDPSLACVLAELAIAGRRGLGGDVEERVAEDRRRLAAHPGRLDRRRRPGRLPEMDDAHADRRSRERALERLAPERIDDERRGGKLALAVRSTTSSAAAGTRSVRRAAPITRRAPSTFAACTATEPSVPLAPSTSTVSSALHLRPPGHGKPRSQPRDATSERRRVVDAFRDVEHPRRMPGSIDLGKQLACPEPRPGGRPRSCRQPRSRSRMAAAASRRRSARSRSRCRSG